MDTRTQKLVEQVDHLLSTFTPIKQSWYKGSMEGFFRDTVGYEKLITECYQLLAHIYPDGHPNIQRAIYAINNASLHSLQQIEGILQGTKTSLEAGFLDDLTSKILLDLKGDFLIAAQELVDDRQKDPAAVLGCVVLEDSLKRLARKHRIEGMESKEMSVVANSLLAKGVIEKTTMQSISSFKALRNAALHAQWTEVSLEAVKLLLVFLPVFIEKHGI